MGYYMRFYDTMDEPLKFGAIQVALRATDPTYRLDSNTGAKPPSAELYQGPELLGVLEMNEPGDGLFEVEIQEMIALLADSDSENRNRVESVLRNAKRTVCLQVLNQGRSTQETLSGIDPLWIWLFKTRPGLLQADGEGYYDNRELILKEGW